MESCDDDDVDNERGESGREHNDEDAEKVDHRNKVGQSNNNDASEEGMTAAAGEEATGVHACKGPSLLEEMKYGRYPVGFVPSKNTTRATTRTSKRADQRHEEWAPRFHQTTMATNNTDSCGKGPSILAEMKAGRYPGGFVPSTIARTTTSKGTKSTTPALQQQQGEVPRLSGTTTTTTDFDLNGSGGDDRIFPSTARRSTQGLPEDLQRFHRNSFHSRQAATTTDYSKSCSDGCGNSNGIGSSDNPREESFDGGIEAATMINITDHTEAIRREGSDVSSTQRRQRSYVKQFLTGVTVREDRVDVASSRRIQRRQQKQEHEDQHHTPAMGQDVYDVSSTQRRQRSYVKQFLTGVTVYEGSVNAAIPQIQQRRQNERGHEGQDHTPAMGRVVQDLSSTQRRQRSYVKQFLTGVAVREGTVDLTSSENAQEQHHEQEYEGQEQEVVVEQDGGRLHLNRRRLPLFRHSYSQPQLTQQRRLLWARNSASNVYNQQQDCNRRGYTFANKFPWLANLYANFETNETGPNAKTSTETNRNHDLRNQSSLVSNYNVENGRDQEHNDSSCFQGTATLSPGRAAGNAVTSDGLPTPATPIVLEEGGRSQLPTDYMDQTATMMLEEEGMLVDGSNHQLHFIFPGAYRVGGESNDNQSVSLESFTGSFTTSNTPQLSAVVVDDEFVAKRQQAILQAYKRKRTMSRDLDDGDSHAWRDDTVNLDGEGASRVFSSALGQQVTTNGHVAIDKWHGLPCAMPIVNSQVIGGGTHHTPTPTPLQQDMNNDRCNFRKYCAECCAVTLLVSVAVLIVVTASGMVFESSQSSSSSNPQGFYGVCFQDREELWRAVDTYMVDSSPGTMTALRYGWPIANWCVDHLSDLSETFSAYRNNQTRSFNEPLTEWNIPMATNVSYMFAGAEAFDQPLGHWNVSNVEAMHAMFFHAKSFQGESSSGDDDKDLDLWDVGTVHDFGSMFSGADNFAGNLCAWVEHMQIDANVQNMFVETACPITADPVIDNLYEEATNHFTALCRPC